MQAILNAIISGWTMVESFFRAIVTFLKSLTHLPYLIDQMITAFSGSNTDFFTWVFAKIIELAVLAYFTLLYYLIPFVWGIAHVILLDIIAASNLTSFASAIPAPINSVLNLMGLYQAFDMIITAYITRWIFKMIPYIGR